MATLRYVDPSTVMAAAQLGMSIYDRVNADDKKKPTTMNPDGSMSQSGSDSMMPNVTQSQSNTQAQSNYQNVNIGSTVGTTPSGFSIPTGASANDILSTMGGLVTPQTSISPGSVSLGGINWKMVGLSAAGVVLFLYLLKRGRSNQNRGLVRYRS